jgi:hypothetical protein
MKTVKSFSHVKPVPCLSYLIKGVCAREGCNF